MISREELKQVMVDICPLCERDIDLLMNEADTNGDGKIGYAEFVDWLTKPAAQSYGRALLDYSSILKPLFQVYDRSGTGMIGREEFGECHMILQSSLRLHPRKGENSKGGMSLDLDAQEVFRKLDSSHEGQVSFTDFVSWMRDHLDTEDLTESELVALTSKISKLLGGIFKVKHMVEEDANGKWGAEEEQLVVRLMENLAKTTAEFQDAVGRHEELDEEAKARAMMSTWSQPPVGLSIQRLKGQHMHLFPVKAHNVEKVDFEVLCVPMPTNGGDLEHRLWVAEVVRKVDFADGKKTVEPPQHYYYNRENFWWVLTESSKPFETALDQLPPELTVFCILKTEADFGVKLDWAGVQNALKYAVDMELISSEERTNYISRVHLEVRDLMVTEAGSEAAFLVAEGVIARRVQEFLRKKFRVRPLQVMASLTRLGVVRNRSLWQQFVDT